MRPLPSVLLMLALVLTAVGLALFVAGPPPSSVTPPSEPRVAEPSARVEGPPPAAVPPAQGRGLYAGGDLGGRRSEEGESLRQRAQADDADRRRSQDGPGQHLRRARAALELRGWPRRQPGR